MASYSIHFCVVRVSHNMHVFMHYLCNQKYVYSFDMLREQVIVTVSALCKMVGDK